MKNEKDQIIQRLNDLIQKPGGHQAARFLLNVMGAIPFVGGVIAGAGAAWGEKEQQLFNKQITLWVNQTDSDLKKVIKVLEDELREPTKASMSLLVGEVFGIDLAQYGRDISFQAILNGKTRTEFSPFVERGWIQFQNNGNVTNMGAGNRVSNSIEDRKRPWGMGNGFNVYITPKYFDDNIYIG